MAYKVNGEYTVSSVEEGNGGATVVLTANDGSGTTCTFSGSDAGEPSAEFVNGETVTITVARD